MNCGESRQYLFAFLDNQLETPLSIELQRHLDGCSDCAREAEIERTIYKRLELGVAVSIPEGLEFRGAPWSQVPDDAGSDNAERSAGPRPYWFHMGTPARIAAALVIVCGGLMWFVGTRNSLSSSRASLVQLAVADFEHFLEEGGKLQIQSDNGARVASWLEAKTGLAVRLPRMEDPSVSLLGGRKCNLRGLPAAFAVFDLRGTPASLVAVDADETALQDMASVHYGGESFRVGRHGSYTVVARRRGPLVYAAVSILPETDLFCLLTEAAYESH